MSDCRWGGQTWVSNLFLKEEVTMPRFSQISIDRLSTCHPKLILLFNELIEYVDFRVTCGYRDEEAQELAFATGLSKVRWPNSKHNTKPSLAVDIAPFPINWKDLERFKEVGYFVLGYSAAKGVNIVWGADWNKNYNEDDEKFIDLPHFQLEEG